MKYLILGNKNAIAYKEIFPLIKENKLWLGINNVKTFDVPDETPLGKNVVKTPDGKKVAKFGNICWFTNLDIKKRHDKLGLYKKYAPEEYPKYDNYDAIEVSKVKYIPEDCDGVMGVPITFLDNYCPEQFEIIGCMEPATDLKKLKLRSGFKEYKSRQIKVNGVICQKSYHRLLIKRK